MIKQILEEVKDVVLKELLSTPEEDSKEDKLFDAIATISAEVTKRMLEEYHSRITMKL